MSASSSLKPVQRLAASAAIMIVASGLILLALVVPFAAPLSEAPLQAGEVAPQDILAPEALTFQSNLLTEEARQKTVAAVPPVYTPTDTTVARRQLERLHSALAYITSVRADKHASPEQKLSDLAAIEDHPLQAGTAQSIIDLTDSRWQAVQQEAIIVLEQIMRSTIQEDKLDEVRTSVPALISLSLTDDQAAIVSELVGAFVIPNSLYDESLTKAARQRARLEVIPVSRSFIAGENIVQGGQVITDIDLEALAQFDLLESAYRWQDFTGAAALSFLAVAFLAIYLRQRRSSNMGWRKYGIIAILFLAFLFSSRLIIPGHIVLPYMFPVAAYAMAVSTLFGVESALVTTFPLAILITYGLPYSLELGLYYVLTSLFGVFVLGRAQRVTSFLWAAAAITACGIAVILAYRFSNPATDLLGLITLAAAALFYGIASSGGALLLQFFLAQILGQTTPLQLMELLRPDHPLLQLLLRNAPGTYQHSLQVANLVEQAAERIGADALLVRIGALYHDVGKVTNASFFIENQLPGNLNPHDDLDPATSASIILNHVPDGLELARKYRLPRSIQDFIAEHHGMMTTRYQYAKALETSGGDKSQVDIEKFSYPGPRPKTRETALLMLADGCEAHVRADRPKDETELHAIIKNVIDNRVAIGALDDTDLTLRDLEAIADSFTATLRGVYHPRIQYPKLDAVTEPHKELPLQLAPDTPSAQVQSPPSGMETTTPSSP